MRLKKTINRANIRSGKPVVLSSERKNSSFVFSGKNKPIYFNRPTGSVFESSVFIKPAISVTSFVKSIQISSNINNFNLKNKLIELGWNQIFPVDVSITIASGVIVGSISTALPAFSIDAFPNNSIIQIINNGKIQGAGGSGGADGSVASDYNGKPGGTALFISSSTFATDLKITNLGQIWGGGGGGGAGGRLFKPSMTPIVQIGLGGGGAGSVPGAAGVPSSNRQYFSGQAGTHLIGGQGGVLSAGSVEAGDGGGPGLPGTSAATWINLVDGSSSPGTNGTGGSAGKYIDGNSFVTWVTTGDVRGLAG